MIIPNLPQLQWQFPSHRFHYPPASHAVLPKCTWARPPSFWKQISAKAYFALNGDSRQTVTSAWVHQCQHWPFRLPSQYRRLTSHLDQFAIFWVEFVRHSNIYMEENFYKCKELIKC